MSRQAHPIRLVTERLSSAQPEQLPRILPSLTETLSLCGDVLSGQEERTKDGSDLLVAAHKLRTQISSLLQEKNPFSRWAAVILIKTSIEAGGVEILQNALAWVRGLLGLLGKQEPDATKNAVILTLTRIFLLTHGRPTLSREITTPSIGPFTTSCLNSLTFRVSNEDSRVTDVHKSLLNTVLQSLIKLVPNHPSSIRPFVGRIRTVVAPLLAPTPSNQLDSTDEQPANSLPPYGSVGLAQRLHALLPHCAAKNGSGEEWSNYLRLTLRCVHRTADKVFRGVVEDRRQLAEASSGQSMADTSEDEVCDAEENELQLPAWQSIYAGCERLIGLLQLLQAYIATKTASSVTVPVGPLFGTLGRVLSVYAPEYSKSKGNEMQLNPSVSREERDSLYAMLPEIHTAAIDCFSLLILRTSVTAMSFAVEVLAQVSWLYQRTRNTFKSNIATFKITCQIVELIGPSFTKENFSLLRPILRSACRNLLPQLEDKQHSMPLESSRASKGAQNKMSQTNPDSFLGAFKSSSNEARTVPKVLEDAALQLVSASLTCLPTERIPFSIRKEMDRAAILLQDEKALLASILNPVRSNKGKQVASLLPFLARQHPASLSTEALLRPRMPPVSARRGSPEDEFSEGEEDMAPGTDLQGSDVVVEENANGDVPALDEMSNTISIEARPKDIMEGVGGNTGNLAQATQLQSPKRMRELEMAESPAGLATSVTEPVAKRPKLGSKASSERPTPAHDVMEQDKQSEPILGISDSPPPVAESSTKAIQPESDSDLDSHGNFEIPPIIFDPDSEEDEDEGEDDDFDDDF